MSTHRLLLLRHAKSSHKNKSMVDFERPLSKRGRKDCLRIATWLDTASVKPDMIISSPAERAAQTARRVCTNIDYPVEDIQWEDSVYDANTRTVLKLLTDVPEDIHTVMIVGHHEALEGIILRMSRWADIPAEPKLIPTCAIAWLEIKGPWADVKKCQARLKSITRPRELARSDSSNS